MRAISEMRWAPGHSDPEHGAGVGSQPDAHAAVEQNHDEGDRDHVLHGLHPHRCQCRNRSDAMAAPPGNSAGAGMRMRSLIRLDRIAATITSDTPNTTQPKDSTPFTRRGYPARSWVRRVAINSITPLT